MGKRKNDRVGSKARRQNGLTFFAAVAFILAGVGACFFMQRQAGRRMGTARIAATQPGAGSGTGMGGNYGISGVGYNSQSATDGQADVIKPDGSLQEVLGNAYKYPADLIHALKRNSEILDFVNGYLTADCKVAGGITLAESGEKYPLFLQWDRRWGYVPYGQSNIGISGCGPTCLSMVLYSLTRDKGLTPDTLAKQAMDGGYYVAGVGTAWSFMKEVALKYGAFVLQDTIWEQNVMEFYLDDGKLLICAMGPGDFTDTGHFIVVRGHSDGKFLVNDPFSLANSSKEWDYDTIASQCRQIWAFELVHE